MSEEASSPQRSPLKRKSTILSNSQLNSPLKSNKSKQLNQIWALVHKLKILDRTTEVDLSNNNLNLITYELGKQKVKNDPKMMAMKLKRLQNDAQIKRAQMQIERRLNKIKKYKKSEQNQYEETYQQQYLKFQKDPNVFNSQDEDSQNQSDLNEKGPEGIRFYSSLRKHPKILQYTLAKKEHKDGFDKTQKQLTFHKIQQIKNPQNCQALNSFKAISQNLQSKQQNQSLTADHISQMSKYFTKKAGNLRDDAKMKHRCRKMVEKQNLILQNLQDSISKDNKKRLQGRLNQIVNEIAKSEKNIDEPQRKNIFPII